MRSSRLVVGLLALLLLGLTVFHVFRNVNAFGMPGGQAWPCGSVALPLIPSQYGLAVATPDDGRLTFLLDQAACSAARDRQLGYSLVFLLPALALTALLIATDGRRKTATEEPSMSGPKQLISP